MHAFAGLMEELGSHLTELEARARKLAYIDTDSMDIIVGFRIESIWLALRDEIAIERVFRHDRYSVLLTVLLLRIYGVLRLMYLQSQFITPDSEVYANRVVDRIEGLLKAYAWQV